MKKQTTLFSLIAVTLLFSLCQASKAEIPFVTSYFDSTWHSISLTSEAHNEMAACNINVVQDSYNGINLNLAQAAGMKGMVDFHTGGVRNSLDGYSYATIDSMAQSYANQYASHPALLGYNLRDEPHVNEFDKLAYAQQRLLAYDPNCIPVVDLFPNYASSSQLGTSSYSQYVSQFCSTVHPKVLSYNNYVFDSRHFDNLSTIRYYAKYGQAEEIPFWYIYLAAPHNSHRDPTEGELRWQMYTALAYGAKGVRAFTYSTVNSPDYSGVGDALIDLAGNPTPKYYMVQEIYGEIQTLAPVLNQLTSTGVYGNSGDGTYVTNVSGGDVVYGRFTDASGKTYMMFTNKDYVNDYNNTIQFNTANVPAVGKVNKGNGRVYAKNMSGGAITKYFAAGDGHLYKVLLDTTVASTPVITEGVAQSMSQLYINWPQSTDAESGIDYYVVYRNGVEIDTVPYSNYTDAGLLPNTSYAYRVSAVNGEGLESALSSAVWVTTIPLPGDANNDGVVDDKDATLLAANWLTTSGASWGNGDFNNDGAVNEKDASILAANWGNEVAVATSVPEPSMLVLFIGMLFVLKSRVATNRCYT